MREIYELKEMLCKELEDYGKKGEMTAGSLDVVDKLAHTIKNLDKILESYDEEYSGRSYNSYERGGRSNRSYGNSYERSYARGRNARRDSRGRYSSEGYSGDMISELNDLMNDAPDDRTRQEMQKFISKMESMM